MLLLASRRYLPGTGYFATIDTFSWLGISVQFIIGSGFQQSRHVVGSPDCPTTAYAFHAPGNCMSNLAFALDLTPAFRTADLFHPIQTAISDLYAGKKVTPVIILDELQLATPSFISELHLLFNFALDTHNPYVLILCGMPSLLNKLAIAYQQPLNQRIILRYKMHALNKDEVTEFIGHHINLAGANHPIFSEAALEAVTSASRGCPDSGRRCCCWALW